MKLLPILFLAILSTSVQAEEVCFKWNNVSVTLDKRDATASPKTVSLVGAITTSSNYAKPVIGSAVLRKDGFWNMIVEGLPQMRLDGDFNPVIPNDWFKVQCQ